MSRIYEEIDQVYSEACSTLTICSNSKGFFKQLMDDFIDIAKTDNWLDDFKKISDERKFEAVQSNVQIADAVKEVFSRIQPLFRAKDAKISYERRLASQAALNNGDFIKALSLASQAVIRAPMAGTDEAIDNGVSLAMALWVRSEILMALGRPRAALEDLKLALKERLPAKMRPQYYWRMGNCYREIGEVTRAKVSYELAERLLGNDGEAKANLTKDIQALHFQASDIHALSNTLSDKQDLKVTGGAKLNIPALSKFVKITEEKDKGRFAVAASSIKTGDILLIDEPYAACLLSDYYGTHCLHCFKRLEDNITEAPLWCLKCSGVVFCSSKCRDNATTYHQYECQFLDLFIGSGMSILSYVALRMVSQAGLKISLAIYSKHIYSSTKSVEGTMLHVTEATLKNSKLKNRKERLNRTKKVLKNISGNEYRNQVDSNEKLNLEEILETNAAQVYSLCFHSEYRSSEDTLKRIFMAMFLCDCLKKGDFFKTSLNIDKDAESICKLLLRNLQLLQFNAHEIYETVRGQHQFSGSRPVYVAVGIYPTGALFNHECYPALARFFNGRNIVLRAIRPLFSGDMISENYGPHFLSRTRQERQRTLACRYWFKCECVACKENWPTLKEMTSESPLFLRCSNIGCSHKFKVDNLPESCPRCGIVINKELFQVKIEKVKQCIALYQKGANLMEKENILEAQEILSKAIDAYHEVGACPHRETHIAQEALRTCFASEGNVHVIREVNAAEDKKQ